MNSLKAPPSTCIYPKVAIGEINQPGLTYVGLTWRVSTFKFERPNDNTIIEAMVQDRNGGSWDQEPRTFGSSEEFHSFMRRFHEDDLPSDPVVSK